MKLKLPLANIFCWITILSSYSPVYAQLVTESRTLDGSDNNPNFTQFGNQHLRIAPPTYSDGISALAGENRPNPREISNLIFNQSSSIVDGNKLSQFTWAWGQFVDHNITHTLLQINGETANITIPENDLDYISGSFIPVSRSIFDPSTGHALDNPRQQTNNITSWLDGNAIYGGLANESNGGLERAMWLRTGNLGKLETSTININGVEQELLPIASQKENAPSMDGEASIAPDSLFISGDVRANENPILTSLHTLFVRFHNQIAEFITDETGIVEDEQLYQAARKVVGASIQAITYQEYLPALGINLEPYQGYQETVDPRISNEFATAGFRVGHTQINPVIPLVNNDNSGYATKQLNLFESFFNPNVLLAMGIEPLFMGLMSSYQQATDAQIVDDLRNLLFTQEINPFSPLANGTDLASLNIQRGRDHGLSDYNTTREYYNLTRINSFAELTSDADLSSILQTLYNHPDNCDLWVCMLAEDKFNDSSLGELNLAILSDQFTRIRDGDRFWYQYDPDFDAQGSLGEIGFDYNFFTNLTLAEIIINNTKINEIPSQNSNVFFVTQVPESSPLLGLLIIGWKLRIKSSHQKKN